MLIILCKIVVENEIISTVQKLCVRAVWSEVRFIFFIQTQAALRLNDCGTNGHHTTSEQTACPVPLCRKMSRKCTL